MNTDVMSAATVVVNNASLKPSDQRDLQTFTLPAALTPPYPLKINPHYSREKFSNWVRQWLLDLKVDKLFSAKAFESLVDMNIGGFAARCHPEAEEWGLQWYCKFVMVTYIADDCFEQAPEAVLPILLDFNLMMLWSFPDDPQLRKDLIPFLNLLESTWEREQKMRSIESILAQSRTSTQPETVYPGEVTLVGNVFRDMWMDGVTRTAPGPGYESLRRIAHYIQYWLLGVIMESQLRMRKTIPKSVDDYIVLRRRTSACSADLVLCEVIYGVTSPDDWYHCQALHRMIEAANDFAAWRNDIVSFKKELLDDDGFNIIKMISIERKITYTEAGKVASKMSISRLADLEEAAADLERISTSPELRQSFVMYVETCRCFAVGANDWGSKSSRYND